MARLNVSRRRKLLVMLNTLLIMFRIILVVCCTTYAYLWLSYRNRLHNQPSTMRFVRQLGHLYRIAFESDEASISQLRMDRQTFSRLCNLLSTRGQLRRTRNMSPEEMVAMFLNILGHHHKNRVVGFNFLRSGRTVSKCFHQCLKAMIRCQREFWKMPEPVPDNSMDPKWKWFKNCLGALDGTYIIVKVPEEDKARYRTRKGQIATNVFGVCSQDMQFIYVLPGWEGSAHDGRVLRDAITRTNGLKIPRGNYYLVDAGYTNGEGFLAPFRGQGYHLNTWRHGRQPRTILEFFNMKHSSARNVIERAFGLLKMRWSILRSPSFYDLKTQRRIISVCCMLHNFIRKEMSIDPMERLLDENQSRSQAQSRVANGYEDHGEEENEEESEDEGGEESNSEFISTVQCSEEWNTWRQNLAIEMFNGWQNRE